jgi:hypothetical protein
MSDPNSLNNYAQNAKLWTLILKLEIARKQKIVLTPEERFNLCNYMNGKPYSRKVLKNFIS